jgi:hypothetical protein
MYGTHMLHLHVAQPTFHNQTIYETSTSENVAYTCFKQQMHDEMNDAHVYEMKNAISGSQTPRVLH